MKSVHLILPALLALVVLCGAVRRATCGAQETTRAGADRRVFVDPVFGMHVGGPQRFAIAFGAERGVFYGVDAYASRFALVEGGLGGGKLVAGIARGSALHFVQLRAALLRTWRDPAGLAPDQSFAGAELRLTRWFVTGGIGRYWRISGDGPGNAAMFAATIGVFH
jgi:hypothetical protein